jgi:trehalose 6-phosphate phosphatase
VRASVFEAAASEPGAYVEDKGLAIAVHVRNAPDPEAAEMRLRVRLAPIATDGGLALLEGKRVLELAPPGGGKGAVVRRLVRGAEAALVAGDDLADLDAFAALDDLDVVVCRVAVLGLESPDELRMRADVAVDGPEGLVVLLRSL